MSLESVVKVTLSANARGVTTKNFGKPMVMGAHDAWSARLRAFAGVSVLDDLVTAGIPSTHPIYKETMSLVSGTVKPETVYIGKALGTFTQQGTLEVIGDPHAGDEYSVDVVDPDGVITTCSYTVVLNDTVSIIATALQVLITAISGITATVDTATISWAADNDNVEWRFVFSAAFFAFADTTPAPTDVTPAADLSAIKLAGDDWYGVLLADAPSKARIKACAAWVETQEKIGLFRTHDTATQDSASTTDVMYELKAASYFRSAALFSADQNSSAAAIWMGMVLVGYEPGVATWKFKALPGTLVDNLTEDQSAAILAKNGNCYIPFAGVNCTFDGKTAGGEWIDIILGRDWTVARTRESVATDLVNAPKIPFTDDGAEYILRGIRKVLKQGETRTIFKKETTYATAPPEAEVSDANHLSRVYPDMAFGGKFAGAIHAVELFGNFTSVA